MVTQLGIEPVTTRCPVVVLTTELLGRPANQDPGVPGQRAHGGGCRWRALAKGTAWASFYCPVLLLLLLLALGFWSGRALTAHETKNVRRLKETFYVGSCGFRSVSLI